MLNAALKRDGDSLEDPSRALEDKELSHLSSNSLHGHECEKIRPPKISLAREELVDLTQDLLLAIVLNQLLYWSKRVKDFELFLEEEKNFDEKPGVDPQYGWFYKSATELSEETLFRVTKVTMRKYIQALIEKGWISERSNPLNKWDKTTQYRIKLKQLHRDLQELGWDVPGFPKDILTSKIQKIYFEGKKITPLKNPQISACLENEPSKETFLTLEVKTNEISKERLSTFEGKGNGPSKETFSTLESTAGEISKESFLTFEGKSDDTSRLSLSTLDGRMDDISKVEKVNFLYLTETTTEITNKEHTQRTHAREDFDKNFFEEIFKTWNNHTNQETHLTDERRNKIRVLLPLYFQNDLAQWKQFCERVSDSSFLMGQGARKWRASLDWILCEENLIKVLEGNFDDGKLSDQKAEKLSSDARNKEIKAVLSSIEDPVWREWCSQLDFSHSSRDPVSLGELKAITYARFLEVEDDRLVWIGSSDAQVLSRIEDLRLKLLSPIKRTFPKVRNLRTRLDEQNPPFQPVISGAPMIPAKIAQHKGDIHYAQ